MKQESFLFFSLKVILGGIILYVVSSFLPFDIRIIVAVMIAVATLLSLRI